MPKKNLTLLNHKTMINNILCDMIFYSFRCMPMELCSIILTLLLLQTLNFEMVNLNDKPVFYKIIPKPYESCVLV